MDRDAISRPQAPKYQSSHCEKFIIMTEAERIFCACHSLAIFVFMWHDTLYAPIRPVLAFFDDCHLNRNDRNPSEVEQKKMLFMVRSNFVFLVVRPLFSTNCGCCKILLRSPFSADVIIGFSSLNKRHRPNWYLWQILLNRVGDVGCSVALAISHSLRFDQKINAMKIFARNSNHWDWKRTEWRTQGAKKENPLWKDHRNFRSGYSIVFRKYMHTNAKGANVFATHSNSFVRELRSKCYLWHSRAKRALLLYFALSLWRGSA